MEIRKYLAAIGQNHHQVAAEALSLVEMCEPSICCILNMIRKEGGLWLAGCSSRDLVLSCHWSEPCILTGITQGAAAYILKMMQINHVRAEYWEIFLLD